MKRLRRQKTTVGVSLFPFLAVLICTMGALIVLLVLVVHWARVDASESARQPDFLAEPDQRRQALEDYQSRRELWEEQRGQARTRVTQRRLELSHLEEHIRELEQQWAALQQAAADLQQRLDGKSQDEQVGREQLAQLQQAIAEAEEELAEARVKAAQQPPVYAIIPYEGPHGTRRRPVYIECRDGEIVIQPEAVRLTPRDFLGPLGPGNPLDAALRAVREYLARAGDAIATGEPYPLLVVRADGIESYALARAAMRSWDDEFGYELIDDTMQLQFPPPDPVLAQLLQKTIADARSRQAILAAAMPSQYERDSVVGFVAAPTRGGFVPADGAHDTTLGRRTGGFGEGGDSRYQQGRAPGTVNGPPDEEEAISSQHAGERGHAGGHAGASVGGSCESLAQSRGRNWALPNARADATPIERPIRVAVLPDRLILLPDRGQARSPEVILVDGAMTDEIDAFVSLLRQRITTWGMAVAGGYWKPLLRVTVAQGADTRFEELQILLEQSGLDVQRSSQ